jgi:hypothetical protein
VFARAGFGVGGADREAIYAAAHIFWRVGDRGAERDPGVTFAPER